MSYIDTSDNVKPDQYTVQAIFAKLDFIEFKTNKMAHEIDTIKDVLELWNQRKIKDSYFLNFLGQFIENEGL